MIRSRGEFQLRMGLTLQLDLARDRIRGSNPAAISAPFHLSLVLPLHLMKPFNHIDFKILVGVYDITVLLAHCY